MFYSLFLNEGQVTLLAGMQPSTTNVYQDGTGTVARFAAIKDLMLDSNRNAYVTDTVAAAIRKVTASGIVSTVATSAALASGMGGIVSYTDQILYFTGLSQILSLTISSGQLFNMSSWLYMLTNL